MGPCGPSLRSGLADELAESVELGVEVVFHVLAEAEGFVGGDGAVGAITHGVNLTENASCKKPFVFY